jgi:hypothetical protein
MNRWIQLKKGTSFLTVALLVLFFYILPKAQAVVPAPDGGYPGGNTAEGQNALFGLTTGGFNTAIGFVSLRGNSTGDFNTAVGAGALFANTESDNTAIGAVALFSNTIGSDNVASGFQALFSNTQGADNTASGAFALFHNTTGASNTAIGDAAMSQNTVGGGNTAIGDDALNFNTTGSGNTAIGAFSGLGIQTASNVICIGAAGVNVSGTCFIGNIRGITPQNPDAIPVLIDSAGQLGTMNSSRRYKTDIKPMDKASESILALKPVSFRYKVHKDTTPQFGLIAEEVAKVDPDLVVRDKNGEVYTVRYEAVNAMLLNEFLKEHKAFLEEQRKVGRLEKQVQKLTAGLQKVSAQLELSKPAPQTVGNSQ